eukprot:scaffold7755_cov104-Cylindrotheca_fusiformis.AAC.14
MAEARVDDPNVNDVLCGRGGSINSHAGNEHFRQLVEKRKRVYLTARFKREKRLIASSIVTEIRELDPPGRFLARKGGKDHGYWYDIGDEKARDKTSQALRENAPSIRAEIETEINQQRQELKQKSDEKDTSGNAPMAPGTAAANTVSSGVAPPPPHAFYNPRSYWDYYYYYYGYPPPPPTAGAPYPPPPPGHHHHHGPPPPGAPPPPPPPPGAYWGAPSHEAAVAMPPPPQPHQKQEDGPQQQEQHDHQMAVLLQQQERQAVFDDRNRWLKSDPAAKMRQSTAFVSPGRKPVMLAETSNAAVAVPAHSFDHTAKREDVDMSQEEIDHRLAVALQEEEDNSLRHQIEHTSRRATRSSAFPMHGGSNNLCRNNISWVNHGNDNNNNNNNMSSPVADSNASNSASAFEQILPTSFVQWTKGFASRSSSSHDKIKKHLHPDDRSLDGRANGRYSPLHFDHHHQNSSAGNMLDSSVGSWDQSNTGMMESSGASFRVRIQQVTSPSAARKQSPSSPRLRVQTLESAEGQEVELMDMRDESGMPPPEPRFSRMGNGFDTSGLSSSGESSQRRHNISMNGISPSHSLDMDESGNSGNGSLGGGSLCNIFAEKDASPDEIIHRVLQQVPSWERSMERSLRSRSPLSMSEVDEDGNSMIRVRQTAIDKPFAPPMTPIKDDPNEMDTGMDWE